MSDALGANVSFSIGVVATKTLPTFPNRIADTGWQLLLASVIIAPTAWIIEGAPPTITPTHVVGFLYLSVIATGVAYVIWFDGIRRLPTQAPPVLGLAAPLTGAGLGWIVLGEDLTSIQILGFAGTVTAILYAATIGSRRPRVESLPLDDRQQVPDRDAHDLQLPRRPVAFTCGR